MDFTRPHARGLSLCIRLTPAARKTGVLGTCPTADGGQALKIAVAAPPEDGRANKELLLLLARLLDLPKSAFTLLSGDTHRQKVILISGDSHALQQKVAAWTALHLPAISG